MVDDTGNQVDDQAVRGWELALLLLGGFRTLVDQMHEVLADLGHPAARPAHGFALQAVGDGASLTELAARLGVSKQAAAKTVDGLVAEGYLTVRPDPGDARRRTITVTGRGREFLDASAAAFDTIVARWSSDVGAAAVADLVRSLRSVGAAQGGFRLDLGSWASR